MGRSFIAVEDTCGRVALECQRPEAAGFSTAKSRHIGYCRKPKLSNESAKSDGSSAAASLLSRERSLPQCSSEGDLLFNISKRGLREVSL